MRYGSKLCKMTVCAIVLYCYGDRIDCPGNVEKTTEKMLWKWLCTHSLNEKLEGEGEGV